MGDYHKLSDENSKVNERLSKKIVSTLEGKFPISGNLRKIKVENLKVELPETNMNVVKDKTLSGGSLMGKVSADVTLLDSNTGKVLEKKNRSIMTFPIMSDKDSFIISGGSYVVPHQQRLLHGSYTISKGGTRHETMVNAGNMRNFKLKLDGDKMMISSGSSNVHAYSVLHDLGVPDSKMESAWGKKVVELQRAGYTGRAIESFYTALTFGKGESTDKKNDILEIMSLSKLDSDSTEVTLGKKYEKVDTDVILDSFSKLLNVEAGKEKADDKENVIFKKIVSVDTMMSEEIDESFKKLSTLIKYKLNNPTDTGIDGIFGSGGAFLGAGPRTFITSSESSRMSEEYNPIMITMSNNLLTPLGRGGVGDTRALDANTKAVHPSHMGFIDPIVSPEGASVGITLAVTDNAYVDENGRPAIGVINRKTGKKEIVGLSKLWRSSIMYPGSVEKLKKNGVTVRANGKDKKVKSLSEVDYIIEDVSDMHAPSTNLLSLMESSDANRANMAQKHVQQAESLVNRELPNVSALARGEDTTKVVARKSNHIPIASANGIVSKITDKEIIVLDGDGNKKGYHYIKDMPLARKSYISHELKVKVGDKVKKGEHLADSNFTKDGHMALGLNARVAWVTQRGNRNDGVVVTESFSKRMSVQRMYKDKTHLGANEELDFKTFKLLYPDEVAKWGASNYDSNGVIKKGSTIKVNQPIAFIVKRNKKEISGSRDIVKHVPVSGKIVRWGHKDDGDVKYVKVSGKTITVSTRVVSPLRIGDKMAARQGNKGVISNVIPDKDAIKDENGDPVEVTLTSNGVISRTNGGSLIEAALGKVTNKSGKRYVNPLYSKEDNLKFALDEMKKHNVSVKETSINPNTNKEFPLKISIGNTYMLRLFKDGESSASGVGVGATDGNRQARKGGHNSAAAISNMEVNALLASKAIGLLKEIKHVKGQENREYFEAFRAGHEPLVPENVFANERFEAYVSQMGVNIKKDKDEKKAFYTPKTDKEIKKESYGRVSNAETVRAKDMKVVKGGLFDESIFGGVDGIGTGHIDLGAKIIHPLYIDTIASLLDTSNAAIKNEMKENGFDRIIKKVKDIDSKKKISELKSKIKSSSNPAKLNKELKIMKFLQKTEDEGNKIEDVVFTSVVPVLSPKMRPISVDHSGDVAINDLNLHYQDILPMAQALTKSKGSSKETTNALKSELYHSVGALYGLEESPNRKLRDKGVKGVMDILTGTAPKYSLNQETMLRSNQFMSGRAVIIPTRSDISIDEVEIPEKIGLTMYEPHISRKMSSMGFTPVETKDMIENKDEKVIDILHDLGKDIPVIYNRAPSLWKHSVVSGYPKFVKGDAIGINPLLETGFNADYDGDQMGLHVPVTRDGIEDAKTVLLPSKSLFSADTGGSNPSLLVKPSQDSTLGIYKASRPSKKRSVRVKNISELKLKLSTGEIHYNDRVVFG